MEKGKKGKFDINILVVEDSPVSQHAIKFLLEKLGCSAEIVSDGKSALKACERFFDLILLDIRLPDMNGIEIAKKIREIKYQKEHRPYIVACTANEKSSKEDYLSCGFDDFITKSFLEEDLNRLINIFKSKGV